MDENTSLKTLLDKAPDPHKLPEGPAWLIRLRNAKDSVEMSDFAARQIAAYVDNLRQAAWTTAQRLENVDMRFNAELLKKAVLGQR